MGFISRLLRRNQKVEESVVDVEEFNLYAATGLTAELLETVQALENNARKRPTVRSYSGLGKYYSAATIENIRWEIAKRGQVTAGGLAKELGLSTSLVQNVFRDLYAEGDIRVVGHEPRDHRRGPKPRIYALA